MFELSGSAVFPFFHCLKPSCNSYSVISSLLLLSLCFDFQFCTVNGAVFFKYSSRYFVDVIFDVGHKTDSLMCFPHDILNESHKSPSQSHYPVIHSFCIPMSRLVLTQRAGCAHPPKSDSRHVIFVKIVRFINN